MRHRPDQEADLLFYKASELEKENKKLRAALRECEEYFDQRADIDHNGELLQRRRQSCFLP